MPVPNIPRARPGVEMKHMFTGIPEGLKGSRRTVQALHDAVDNGGFTQSPSGERATTGYAVAQKGTTGITKASDAITPMGKVSIHAFNDMDQWRKRHNGAIYAAGHMGGWNNKETGNIVFNAAQVLGNRDEAIRQGGPSEQDQISVFHLDKFDEIPTGGKGDEERNYPRVTESKRAKKQFPS